MDKKIISLGLDQSSTTLYFMSCMEALPRADLAVFADPGSELPWTYQYLQWLIKWQIQNDGIPIVVAKAETNIYKDLFEGQNDQGQYFFSIPTYIKKENGEVAMSARKCTGDYKTRRVNKAIREFYGLRKYGSIPKTEIWLGITLDKISRVHYPDHQWQRFVYPFCNYQTEDATGRALDYRLFTQSDCESWLKRKRLPVPARSSCFFCPYQDNESWLRLKLEAPEIWQKAVVLDQRLRQGKVRNKQQPMFLHQQCVPLNEVNLYENQLSMIKQVCGGSDEM